MYIDPGFGSMIIQFVVAGFAMIGAWFFMFRHKISAFLLNRKKNKSSSIDADNYEANIRDKKDA